MRKNKYINKVGRTYIYNSFKNELGGPAKCP